MTATERAKRSDALYYETFSVTRRVLCDMIANREADLEDAQAENAKLRELATDALKHIIEVECEAPNRERFRGKPCEDCTEYGSSDCPKIMARMYGELGVEVDG